MDAVEHQAVWREAEVWLVETQKEDLPPACARSSRTMVTSLQRSIRRGKRVYLGVLKFRLINYWRIFEYAMGTSSIHVRRRDPMGCRTCFPSSGEVLSSAFFLFNQILYCIYVKGK